jgi:hypothetical protein
MAAALAAASVGELEPGQSGDLLSSTATRPAPGTAPLAPSPAAAAMAFTPSIASELQASLRDSLQHHLKDQLGEQRRFMLATFEAFARRLNTEVKESIARIPPPPSVESLLPAPTPNAWWPAVLTAVFATVPALVLGYIAWSATGLNATLQRDLDEARAATERAKAAAVAAAATASATMVSNAPLSAASLARAGGTTAAPAQTVTEYVPYGEAPLSGNRLERLRELAATLEAQQFTGRVRVESFVGDFCLTGNSGEGFEPADTGLAASKCDIVGNPYDDSLSTAQRQSVAFANFVATLQRRTGGAIQIEIVNGGRDQPVAYPEQEEKTTAGVWNTVAAQNNRVEFRILPSA